MLQPLAEEERLSCRELPNASNGSGEQTDEDEGEDMGDQEPPAEDKETFDSDDSCEDRDDDDSEQLHLTMIQLMKNQRPMAMMTVWTMGRNSCVAGGGVGTSRCNEVPLKTVQPVHSL